MRAELRALAVLVVAVMIPFAGVAADDATYPEVLFRSAEAMPRLALVVASQDYEELERVPNALSDARDVAQVLNSLGFDAVLLPNARRADIMDYVRALEGRAASRDGAALVLFFFAGHGFQQNGTDFILPTDSSVHSLANDAIPVTYLTGRFDGRRGGFGVFIIDACRTSKRLEASTPRPGGSTPPPSPSPPPGRHDAARALPRGPRYLAAFASENGRPALSFVNSTDPHSPFTEGFLNSLATPGLDHDRLLRRVRKFVEDRTRDIQDPPQQPRWDDVLSGRFVFFRTAEELQADERAWESALATNSVENVQEFIDQNPDSRYVMSALRWLAVHR